MVPHLMGWSIGYEMANVLWMRKLGGKGYWAGGVATIISQVVVIDNAN